MNSRLPILREGKDPRDYPLHAAVLALIDRHNVFVAPTISSNDIRGMTSYLREWGPEGYSFTASYAHSSVIVSILIDLEDVGYITYDTFRAGYAVTTMGAIWLQSDYFTHEYFQDLLTLISWYNDIMKGPDLKLGRKTL